MDAFTAGAFEKMAKPSHALKGIREVESGKRREAQPPPRSRKDYRAAAKQVNRQPSSALAGIREVEAGGRHQPQPRRSVAKAAIRSKPSAARAVVSSSGKLWPKLLARGAATAGILAGLHSVNKSRQAKYEARS